MKSKKIISLLTTFFLCLTLVLGSFSVAVAEDSPEVSNGIPVLSINIDENAEGYGTIAQMNESHDHSVECTGTINLDVPDGYKGDYSETVLSDTDNLKLDYIRGRGNTTWFEDKKPYKIKLNKKADLLGMGKNKHWVLLANARDITLLRNRIISYIGSRMGLSYTPKMLPVDVVMNGEYLGSYYLAEQVRIGETRINIDELTVKDNTEPNITGGYLLAYVPYDDEPEENVLTTEHGLRFQGESPEFYSTDPTDEIGTSEQKTYITDYLQKIENAVYGEDFRDENRVSVSEYMDFKSTADYWWIQEFSKNVDSFNTSSTYLYKPRNDKMYWGPLWDFDLSLGNSLSDCDGFYFSDMPWLDKLRAENTEYQQILRDRWVVLDSIITDIVKDGGVLDQYIAETKNSWEADNEIWQTDKYGDGIDFQMDILRKWLKDRQEWINKNIDTKLTKVYMEVSFVADGKAINTQSVLGGKRLDYIPDAPEKDGYIFGYWEQEDGNKFEGYEIRDDMTLTAVYIKEKDIIKAEKIYFMTQEVWHDISDWNQYYTQYSLTPFDTNDKIVSWSSSDDEIAVVDSNGIVTEKKTGNVTITATLRSGAKFSYTLHIYDSTVTPTNEIKSIKVAKNTITLNEGEYAHIDVTVSPQPCQSFIYFDSNDFSVAEVDSNGVIKANREGTTTIIVSTDNDKTAKVKVIVKSTKKPNTIKASVKTKSIRAKKLKTKARKVKPLTITKAKGTVTVKTTSVKFGRKKISVKKFKFNKTGKLTVKKGKYNKGTYKIKVKITAKGTASYKPKTLNKIITLKVK